MMRVDDSRVLIAGGGPVGLFCALLLGRRGLAVRLFEVNEALREDPRAATTHPGTLEVLGSAGLTDDMARVGLIAPIFQFWDRPSGEKIAEFDHAVLKDDTSYPYVNQCEQFKTSRIILERLRGMASVEVLFEHEVTDVVQSENVVTATVRGPGGSVQLHSGAYLIGADGGRSTVRKASGIAFDGFTWPERFIVLTTPFDFGAHRGYCPRSYFADPEEWCNCFKVSASGPPGLWRTVFPTDPALSDEALMNDAAVQARLQKFFPSPEPYEIVHRNLYVTHQRVAASFRAGRVLLAGDAAHVNNPIGGMGLNGGLQDAANLSEKLAAVLCDGAPEVLIDLYNLQRRTVAIEFVQEQTIANKRRLEVRDAQTRAKNLAEEVEFNNYGMFYRLKDLVTWLLIHDAGCFPSTLEIIVRRFAMGNVVQNNMYQTKRPSNDPKRPSLMRSPGLMVQFPSKVVEWMEMPIYGGLVDSTIKVEHLLTVKPTNISHPYLPLVLESKVRLVGEDYYLRTYSGLTPKEALRGPGVSQEGPTEVRRRERSRRRTRGK